MPVGRREPSSPTSNPWITVLFVWSASSIVCRRSTTQKIAKSPGVSPVVFHGTYALHSALLTAGFMTALALRGQWRKAALVGVVALAVVAPAVGYNVRSFTADAKP